MKKLIIGMLSIAFISLFACQKETTQSTNDALMNQISASERSLIDVSQLPAGLRSTLSNEYSGIAVIEAYFASGKGYEVDLVNNTQLFFNIQGGLLGHRPHIHPCLEGDSMDISLLPTAITDYISTNYDSSVIVHAIVAADGSYAVAINHPFAVLIFSADGTFVERCLKGGRPDGPKKPDGVDSLHRDPCLVGDSLDITALPSGVGSYVTQNYPNSTIVKAMTTPDTTLAVLLAPQHMVLIFSTNGDFIGICRDGKCDNSGGGHKGPGDHRDPKDRPGKHGGRP